MNEGPEKARVVVEQIRFTWTLEKMLWPWW